MIAFLSGRHNLSFSTSWLHWSICNNDGFSFGYTIVIRGQTGQTARSYQDANGNYIACSDTDAVHECAPYIVDNISEHHYAF